MPQGQQALADAVLHIRNGACRYGTAFLSVMGSKFQLGDSAYTSIIFTLDGSKVREGDSNYGSILVMLGNDSHVH